MKNKYFSPIPRSNEVLSYLNAHYPTFNTVSNKSSMNIFKKENNRKNSIQKLIFERNNHQCLKMNHKKNIMLDEDDTKNSENFKLFMDSLLSKENSDDISNNKNSINSNNSINHSTNNFFMNKLNYNINHKCSKKEDDLYYSFHDNKYISSFPKKRLREILCDIDNNKNIDIKKNSDFKINIDKFVIKNTNFNSLDNILNQFQTKTKNVGIDCKISEDYLFEKAKERNITFNPNHRNKKNNKNIKNNRNKNDKLTQTFSLREFDGRMIHKLIKVGDNAKNSKKNNSKIFLLNKNKPDFKMPKIIFYSRNSNLNKENMHQLMTMKENAILFLKDKTENHFSTKDSNTLKNKNINFNNMHFSKETYVPLTKLKRFNKEKNQIPFFKRFEKYYLKKPKKKMNSVDSKKNMLTKFNKKYYYQDNDLDNVIIKNYK